MELIVTINTVQLCQISTQKWNTLELHKKCPISKCNCQKQVFFTPNQFQLEGARFKKKMAEKFQRDQSSLE